MAHCVASACIYLWKRSKTSSKLPSNCSQLLLGIYSNVYIFSPILLLEHLKVRGKNGSQVYNT